MTEVELKQLALKEKEFRSERIKTGNSTHWHENASKQATAHTGTEMLQNGKQYTLARICFKTHTGTVMFWNIGVVVQSTICPLLAHPRYEHGEVINCIDKGTHFIFIYFFTMAPDRAGEQVKGAMFKSDASAWASGASEWVSGANRPSCRRASHDDDIRVQIGCGDSK